ncbi:MAG: hypothetical protein ACREXY_11635 [Gammaproteobacteria bacterium]
MVAQKGNNQRGWLRKKVTTNRDEKQRRDDIDVNFLFGGPKESSEVGRKKLPKPDVTRGGSTSWDV